MENITYMTVFNEPIPDGLQIEKILRTVQDLSNFDYQTEARRHAGS